MKRRMLTVVGVFAIIFAVAAGASFAQKETGGEGASTGGEFKPYEAAKGERINAFMVEKIVGSKVRNMQGEDLGTVEDIVVDIDTDGSCTPSWILADFWASAESFSPFHGDRNM